MPSKLGGETRAVPAGRRYAPRRTSASSRNYPTDLTDAEWRCLKGCLRASGFEVRPRVHGLRDILDAIFYVVRSGCPWRLLPRDFPPWQTVYYHLRCFESRGFWWLLLKILRAEIRRRSGRRSEPTAAIMDSQSVKTTEESARWSGYDAHKRIKGRKRHLLVDTLGLPLSVYVAPADVQDREGARRLLAGLRPLLPRLKKIWADEGYGGEALAGWCERQGGWDLEIVGKLAGAGGFSVSPRRWVVERSFSWLRRNRRLARDYERRVQTSEVLIEVAMVRLMLARLAGGAT